MHNLHPPFRIHARLVRAKTRAKSYEDADGGPTAKSTRDKPIFILPDRNPSRSRVT
jgi:hypothetical protein